MKRRLLYGATGIIIILVLTALALDNLLVAPGRSNPDPGTANTFDAFLKIDNIPGESQEPGHLNEIQIISFSWAGSQGALPRADKTHALTQVQDIHFRMNVSKASPKLWQASCKGSKIRTVVLTVRRASDKKDFLKCTFSDAMISSYATAGNVSDPSPIDEITIRFTRIDLWYQQYDSGGNKVGSPITSYWDATRGSDERPGGGGQPS